MLRDEEFEKVIESSFWISEAGDIGVAVAGDVFKYFENKTCDTCEFGTRHKQKTILKTERIFCENFVREDIGRELNSLTFGCNMWRSKDD